ncbi:hypothetical protein [Halostella limicola]|uniref:hypothetical protein n=1 Tax=Halostella limicola TaxID=2448456 RepID=UPI000EF83D09|nr:hypothetical protein [Halostella limicola]
MVLIPYYDSIVRTASHRVGCCDDYESKRLQGFVAVASVVLGFLMSWVLSLIWIEIFGFPRIMTTLTRYVAIFTFFFLLSYPVNETSLLE